MTNKAYKYNPDPEHCSVCRRSVIERADEELRQLRKEKEAFEKKYGKLDYSDWELSESVHR